MRSWKKTSIVLGVVVAALSIIWISMQIHAGARSDERRPNTSQLVYVFNGGQPLPKGCVVTNNIGNEVNVDSYSRFQPLSAWQVGTEVVIWGPKPVKGERERIGTATLTARAGEWIRIDL